MTGDRNTREELVRLTQVLVVEGARFVEAFATLHGLHHTDVEALTLVKVAQERGVPMTAGALAEELGLTSGAVTAVVDRLERVGHVSRVRDQADRRRVFLRQSPGGQALADEYFVPVLERSAAVMDQFSPEELEVVRRYLAATGAAMAEHRGVLVRRAKGDAAQDGPAGRVSSR